MPLQWCDKADAALGDLTSEKSPTDLVLFVVDNPKAKQPLVRVMESGPGGRQRLADLLRVADATQILIACFLCSAIDERGSIVSVRRKYIQVTWLGGSVSVMVKGKVQSWVGDLRHKLPAAALSFQLTGDDLDDLQGDTLQHGLLAAGGAHKPTRYSFTNRTLIGSLQLDDAAAAAAEAERLRREAELQAQREAAAEKW